MSLTKGEQQECAQLLRKSILFRNVKDEHLQALAKRMTKRKYRKGDLIMEEGQPQTRMFIISSGVAVREKTMEGRVHRIDTQLGGSTIGSLHVMSKDPCYSSTKCLSEVTTYELSSEDLTTYFSGSPDFAFGVAISLSNEIRRFTKAQRTPLLEQKPKKTPYMAVSIAASIESFYRAALNAILNQQLTGVKMTSLFPNMHVQVPTRIVYINGFKGFRHYLDNNVRPEDYANPNLVRLGEAVVPGLVMSPVSSILEASNAGHANPEPLHRRWARGFIPRCGREVIFGIGLNQLSDYCEERVPFIDNDTLRNAAGSLMAGVMSGYMSHVVHNLSTMKLMNPNKTYAQHFAEYSKRAESRIPSTIPPSLRGIATIATACLLPTGVLIRTTQIVGSFIILNGTINTMQKWF